MAGDPSGSSILEELDSSTVLPLAGTTRIKDDVLTQGSDRWEDVQPLASAWANYVGEPRRLTKLAATFHQHGGTTIFPPVEQVPVGTYMAASSAYPTPRGNNARYRHPNYFERTSSAAAAAAPTSAGTPVDEDGAGCSAFSDDTFRILLQPGDFCLPVCEDGTAESQVTYLLLQLLQRRQSNKISNAGVSMHNHHHIDSEVNNLETDVTPEEALKTEAGSSENLSESTENHSGSDAEAEEDGNGNGNPDVSYIAPEEDVSGGSDLSTLRINLPHGALGGFDPYCAYSNLDSVNCNRFYHVTMEERNLDDDVSHQAFRTAFGRDKAPRYGKHFAAQNRLQLNLSSVTASALSQLEQDRTAMRSFMNATIYNMTYLRQRVGSVPVWVLDRTVTDRGESSSQCTSSQGMGESVSPRLRSNGSNVEEEPTLSFTEGTPRESKYTSPVQDTTLPRRINNDAHQSCLAPAGGQRRNPRRVRIGSASNAESKESIGDPMGPAKQARMIKDYEVSDKRSALGEDLGASRKEETLQTEAIKDEEGVDNDMSMKDKSNKDEQLIPGRVIFLCSPTTMSTILWRLLEVNCGHIASDFLEKEHDGMHMHNTHGEDIELISDLFQDIFVVCLPQSDIQRDPGARSAASAASSSRPTLDTTITEYLESFKHCAKLLRNWPIVDTKNRNESAQTEKNDKPPTSPHGDITSSQDSERAIWHSEASAVTHALSEVSQEEDADVEINENDEASADFQADAGSEVDEDVKETDAMEDAPEPADIQRGHSFATARSSGVYSRGSRGTSSGTTPDCRSLRSESAAQEAQNERSSRSRGQPELQDAFSPTFSPSAGIARTTTSAARESSGVPEENITSGQVPDEEDP
eukprot:gb/GECG01003896.1/.p1 GENE.gb/GECG01003896.1/~~gb/GECG01003896.1/.p1  ORF type:complete len:865 (+),score=136.73 gb/GECG01003896.1/:1-2595(+)